MSKAKIYRKELFQFLFEKLLVRKRSELNSIDKQRGEVRRELIKTTNTLKATVQKFAEIYYDPYIKPVNNHFQKLFPGWGLKVKAHLNEMNQVETVLELVKSDPFITNQDHQITEMLRNLVDKQERLGIDLESKDRKADALSTFLSDCSWETKPMNRILGEVTRGLNEDDKQTISELLDKMGTVIDVELDILGVKEDPFFTEQPVEGVI